MIGNLLLFALIIASLSLNVVDALLTRIGLRSGYRERNPFMRNLIEKIGLDKAMIVKSLLVVPLLVVFVISGWYIPIIDVAAIVSLIIVVIFYSFLVFHDYVTLRKAK